MRRLVGVRWGSWQRPDLSNLSVPRVRLYDGDTDLLVNVCIGDRHNDPVVGFDFYVTGVVGEAWCGWLWDRRRRRNGARRAG